MTETPQISDAFFISAILGVAIMIFFPLLLGFIANRRLHVGWRYFGYGALIFILFQLVTRIPLVAIAGVIVGPAIAGSVGLQVAWGAVLAFTAGLFENVGRYVGYRWLMGKEEKTWSKGVMYGLGHGGVESMVLIAGIATLQIIGLLTLQSMGLESIPAEQRELAAEQLAAVAAQPPWVALLGAWERIWTIAFHVAMSVLVLQCFRRGSMIWLLLAILLHTAIDFIVPTLIPLLDLDATTTALLSEAVVTIFGLFSIWLIFRFREPDQPAPAIATAAAEPAQEIRGAA